jgi:ribosomal protein S24E
MAIRVQEAYRTPNKWDLKRILLSHNNQNTKCTQQGKNIKRCKGKRPSNIQRKIYQSYTRLLNRDYESQKNLVKGHADSKKTQMPAQAMTPSKNLNQHRWRNQNIPGQNKIYLPIQPYRRS